MNCVILIWILCKLTSFALQRPSSYPRRHDFVTHSFFTRLLQKSSFFPFCPSYFPPCHRWCREHNIFNSNYTSHWKHKTNDKNIPTCWSDMVIYWWCLKQLFSSANFYFSFLARDLSDSCWKSMQYFLLKWRVVKCRLRAYNFVNSLGTAVNIACIYRILRILRRQSGKSFRPVRLVNPSD